MICIIAGTYSHAKKWAVTQQLLDYEWFCTLDFDELNSRENFHVIVLKSAEDLPTMLFEKLYNLAQTRGRLNRE